MRSRAGPSSPQIDVMRPIRRVDGFSDGAAVQFSIGGGAKWLDEMNSAGLGFD